MPKFHFQINGSEKLLSGTVTIRGAKNDALKALASSLLFSTQVTIKNIPIIEDILRTKELLNDLGATVHKRGSRTFIVDPRKVSKNSLKKSIAESLRASIVLVGPLLARNKKVIFPHPGGCVIGKRPINLFLEGWKAMGAHIRIKDDIYTIAARKLKGCDFTFRSVSVTATESLIMTAALAHGETTLRNAACEPEIPHLADFLNRSGAHVRGAGTSTIHIVGTGGKLLQEKGPFVTIPDRIEVGSFAILAALRGKKVKIKNCNPEHLSVFFRALEDCGVNITYGKNWVLISRPKILKPTKIITREYPGFPTDLQAPFVTLMTQAKGMSSVFETVYDGRLNYIEDLNRMGAQIVMCDPHRVIVIGPTPLRARYMESPDIRAGLAFIIASALANGTSTIENVYQIDRGYEKIDRRMKALGIDIKRGKS